MKKDVVSQKHSDALPIPNLEVMKLLQSFASRKFVTETFNWQYFYYALTDEGIKYLREYLGLPEDTVPLTMKKSTVTPVVRQPSRANDDKRKSAGPGGSFNPDFKGGRGERRDGGRDYRRKEN